MDASIFTPEILARITEHYNKCSGYSGDVTVSGTQLLFPAKTARAYAPGQSVGGWECPQVYSYDFVSGRDVNGRPGQWYGLRKLFRSLGITQ